MRDAEKKNPFPPKGVLNLEAGIKDQLPTIPTASFKRAYQLAADYVFTRIGQVVTVTGPYGSGKTHLIYYALQQVEQKFADASPCPVQLYVKAGSYDFLAVYRELAGQLDQPLLRILNARFLGHAVSEEMNREQKIIQQLRKDMDRDHEGDVSVARGKESISAGVLAQLRKDPHTVYQYLNQLFVTPEQVLGGRSSEVRNITKAGRDDFKKVIFYLDDKELAADAHDWLIARRDLSSDALQRLGVRGQIADADDALDALRLLVRLFRYAEIPLLVYIDQIEQLLVDIDKELVRANAERLKSIVEYFANNNAFLLLSGADEAWSHFREDFFGRVGPPITVAQITPKQSRDLVKIYLQEGMTYQPYKEPPEILPFTPEGVDEILRLRGGNMRRFLQTCHVGYVKFMSEERAGVIIDPPFVQQVVKDGKGFFDRKTVFDEIKNILRRKNLKFGSQINLTKNFRPDFVIGDVTNPSVVIGISDSLFYEDEAEKALRIVNFREDLDKKNSKTKLIIIPMGYVSPEVLTYLRGVVDSCIVYEVEGFTAMFEAEIDSFLAQEKEVLRPEVDQKIKDALGTAKKSFQELLATRESEIEALNMRLDTFLRAQTGERQKGTSAQRHEEWRNWLRKDQQRWEQRQAELKQKADDERRQLQQEGENLRWKEPLADVPYLIVSGLVAWLLMYALLTFGTFYVEDLFFGLLMIVLAVSVFLMSYYYYSKRRRLQQEGEALQWKKLNATIRDLLVFCAAALLVYIIVTGSDVGFYEEYIYLRQTITSGFAAIMVAYLYFLHIHRKLFPLRFQTGEVATSSGDLRQLALSANTSYVSRLQASQSIQNPNPLIRYFGAHVFLTKYKDALTTHQWCNKAILETWIPLYLVYLKLTKAKEPRLHLKHLDLLLKANPEDPRIVYAISDLSSSSHYKIPNCDLWNRYLGNPRYTKVLTHAIFEGFFEELDACLAEANDELHVMVKFACAYSPKVHPPEDSEMEELANRFRKFGRFWDEDTEGPIKLKLTEDELRTIINTLTPYQEFGLASFQELPISNLYLRLYRFFAEIEWRLDRNDVVLGT